VITGLESRDARTDLFDDTGSFMSKNCREQAFRIFAGQCESIGVANARGHDPDQNFALPGSLDVDGFNRQRLTGCPCDCGARFH
jgi:hypothetical protein